ncbi:hypothetical protein K7W42_01655 [Deinococcus sp. HMF7604]|uniref:hypothetical protein n=1 Tax=Deinococcus betulae TaxID=2873312 RepID=UPI001CCC6448|nr:hypothetical protein [Deinococcus betulae]MBZ9749560.1 hypothetical protein [Deinococcus betulae]
MVIRLFKFDSGWAKITLGAGPVLSAEATMKARLSPALGQRLKDQILAGEMEL